MMHDQKEECKKVMQEELKSLHKNKTYDLIGLQKGRKILKNKWVFKIKNEDDKKKMRYKAMLVVKGLR